MSRVPNWDPGARFHEPARGYDPAVPTAHDQFPAGKGESAPRVEADPLQRSFEPDRLQQERVRPEFRSGACRNVASPPLYLRQRKFLISTGDSQTPDLSTSPSSTPRFFPASLPDLSPRQFFPTYQTHQAYPSPTLFPSSPEPSNFNCQATPELYSAQTSSPGTSIWSPVGPWECSFNQIGSSPSVTTKPLVVKTPPQFTAVYQSDCNVSEQQPIPSYNPNTPTLLSNTWTPPPRRPSDKAERRLLSPKKTKTGLNSENSKKSPSQGFYSARTKQQTAGNFERPSPDSSETQAAEERSTSPYERPSPPTPSRGVQKYTKPQKSFGKLTRKASRVFTALSGQKARKFSDTVKHAFKRDKESCLDSLVFDERQEDTLATKQAQSTVSQAHPPVPIRSWHLFDQPEFLESRPSHASSERSDLEVEVRTEAPSPEAEAEAPHIRHPLTSLEEHFLVNNLLEERPSNSEYVQAVHVPQLARSLYVASSVKLERQSSEQSTPYDFLKKYPSNQLPLGLPRRVGRLESYQSLFGTIPAENVYLGGSDAGSDTTKGTQRTGPEEIIKRSGKVTLKRSPRLRRRNATIARGRIESENNFSNSIEKNVGRLEPNGGLTVTEKGHFCDGNVASGVIENLITDSKIVKSASGIKLDRCSDIERSRSEHVVSNPSDFGPKRLTSKVVISEIPANNHPRPTVQPPVASRKVSDLRAKFEQATEQSVTSFPKKTVSDLQFGKKRFVKPHSGEGLIGLQRAGGKEAAEPPPSFLAKQTTKLAPLKNDSIKPLANLKISPAHKDYLSRLTNEGDQLVQTETVLWLDVGDEENNPDPPPPIPRKSVKRAAESLPRLNQQEQQRCSEIVSEVGLPSQIDWVNSQPVTPENKIGPANNNTLDYYSDSVYSEDETQKSQHKTTSETAPQVQKYQTPPDSHPDLLIPPLAIRKKDRNSQQGTLSPPSACASPEDPFEVYDSFLGRCLAVAVHPTQMATLHVDAAIISSTKTKAVEDARVMQQAVIESCKKAGRDPPKYVLLELIGKGSFGRVYKSKDVGSGNIVAVKIIDIDESDTLNPRLADTYSEFMKEVNALKILSESKARNINLVIEALPVGKAMWMITEYCGGGSIATLMKPTPTGLKERFIIPILREVAEAVKWVHQAGIIHRDLKCANILITEEGGVQLCDFGVAGIVEGAVDKRSTFIGTPNWMAPELFQGSSYGKEVDIWAFGSMAYEMATGLPPNARSGVTGMDLGSYLKNHIPRLEGSTYSEGLKSIIAYCLEVNPSDRPIIEAVQKHNFIYNSNTKYPASSLSELVRAFKMWESHGGTRKSLFMAGGAQASSEPFSTTLTDDDWNFSTTAAFDQAVAQDTSARDVINVYGPSVALDTEFSEETSRPSRSQELRAPRRRPPPEALAPLKGPLEKLFDPNTISTYEENSRSHYNQYQNNIPDIPSIDIQSIPTREVSDLPLRDVTNQTSIRDTLIDLDAYDVPSGLSSFTGMDTIRPTRQAGHEGEGEYDTGGYHDFHRPALSDPLDNPNRRTQDWKFPVMAPPASAAPDMTRFPATYEPQRPVITPASGARPALAHHATEPISLPTQGSNSLLPSAPGSPNRMSLIDLDLSLPEPSRPSTADSTVSQEITSANPFHLEGHASLYHPSAREPSLYVSEDLSGRLPLRIGNALQDLVDQSDLSASDAEGPHYDHYNGHAVQTYENGAYSQPEYDASVVGHFSDVASSDPQQRSSQPYTMAHFPDLPPPPSVPALSGSAAHNEMIEEMHRMLGGLTAQLESFRDVYETQIRAPARRGAVTEED